MSEEVDHIRKIGDHYILERWRHRGWMGIICACGEEEEAPYTTNFGSLLAKHIQNYNKRVKSDDTL